jgi:nucleoside-diphosphate-sugar epimerase
MRKPGLARIIVTGASGFVGRNFIDAYKDECHIYAIARRSQQEVGLDRHQNIEWFLADIAEEDSLHAVMQTIRDKGGADFLLHLAAFFDFSNEPNPEYERSNILGTKLVLAEAESLDLIRFIFASSLVVSEFPKGGDRLTEKSALDASFPYAVTKIAGEAMVKEYSAKFPCTVVRFAAVFSDWCEYGPLYKFIDTWTSRSWKANILGGKGLSSVPYIHIFCVRSLLWSIMEQTDSLKDYDVFLASPDESTSHQELYDQTTRLITGKVKKAIHMPILLSELGVVSLDILGRLVGKRPFERPWMMKYIDERMDVDASYTRETLSWDLIPRYTLSRRLIHLIEHMKAYKEEWHTRNALALYKTPDRPDLLITEVLSQYSSDLLSTLHATIRAPINAHKFSAYQKMPAETLSWYLGILFNLLNVSLRTGDRLSMANYARFNASIRIHEGFGLEEVSNLYKAMADIVINFLSNHEKLTDLGARIQDDIGLTIQMALDEIEDAYELAMKKTPYVRFHDRK